MGATSLYGLIGGVGENIDIVRKLHEQFRVTYLRADQGGSGIDSTLEQYKEHHKLVGANKSPPTKSARDRKRRIYVIPGLIQEEYEKFKAAGGLILTRVEFIGDIEAIEECL